MVWCLLGYRKQHCFAGRSPGNGQGSGSKRIHDSRKGYGGVREYSDGFLLSEVPLGRGFLDLSHIFDLCEKAYPQVQFCLEMITRDPLKIPCLTQNYWATFKEGRAQRLAKALQMVRANKSDQALPRISNRPADAQLQLEEHNGSPLSQICGKGIGGGWLARLPPSLDRSRAKDLVLRRVGRTGSVHRSRI